jgi:hypothetical protein
LGKVLANLLAPSEARLDDVAAFVLKPQSREGKTGLTGILAKSATV